MKICPHLPLALAASALITTCSSDHHGSADDPSSGAAEEERFETDSTLEDFDADGLPNALEAELESRYRDPHSPYRYGHLDLDNGMGPTGDELPDGLERYLVEGGALPPITHFNETDGDGIPDYFEVGYGTNPFDDNSPVPNGGIDVNDETGPSGDEISDALEALLIEFGATPPVTRGTSTDGDPAPDFVEVIVGTDPFDPESRPESTDDLDGDGLPNYLEILEGFAIYDPNDPIRDGSSDDDMDAIPNGLEGYLTARLNLPENSINYSTESDGDGIPDVHEVFYAISPADDPHHPIPNGDHDEDGDGLRDGLEGYVRILAGDANLDVDEATHLDGDGLPAVLEVTLRSGLPADPSLPYRGGDLDGDLDGVVNGVEAYLESLEGQPPIVTPVTAKTDSDCDGRPDADEVLRGRKPQRIDLEHYADVVLPNVITFDCNGQYEDAHDVRYVALRALSTQSTHDRSPVYIHEIRLRDHSGKLIPTTHWQIYQESSAPPPHERLDQSTPSSTRPPDLLSLIDGVGLDTRDPDPTRWTAADDPDGRGMYQSADGSPFAFVIIDLGASYHLSDLLIWNGLKAPRHAIDELAIDLLSETFDYEFNAGPGGIEPADGESALSMWLDAARGPSTNIDSEPIDHWWDRSGWERDGYASGATRPIYRQASSARGLPTVAFERDLMNVPRPVTDDFTLTFVAASTLEDTGNWWDTPGAFFGHEVVGCDGDMGMAFNGGRFLWAACDIHRSDQDVSDGLPHLLTVRRNIAKDSLDMYVDGRYILTGPAEGQSFDSSEEWGLGHIINADRFTGEIWEMLAYSRALNDVERDVLDNAYAAKFGIAIENDLYPFDLTHIDAICGLGMDKEGQEVSRARGRDFLEVRDPTLLSPGDRLLWGTSGIDPYSLSYDVPIEDDKRLEQTWAFRVTDGGNGDGIGTVDLRFYVGRFVPDVESLAFTALVSETGHFRRATRYVDAVLDRDAKTVTFEDVWLPTEGFFGLAFRVVP